MRFAILRRKVDVFLLVFVWNFVLFITNASFGFDEVLLFIITSLYLITGVCPEIGVSWFELDVLVEIFGLQWNSHAYSTQMWSTVLNSDMQKKNILQFNNSFSS